MRFRLVDLLALTGFCCVLLAIAPMFLGRARGGSRTSTCASNLRSFGQGFAIFSERDPAKRYCSGPLNYSTDGDPANCSGWTSDLWNIGAASPGQMLCPSNYARASEALDDWLCSQATSPQGTATLPNEFVDLNTNYSQSWYIARWTIRTKVIQVGSEQILVCAGDQRDATGAFSGCTMRDLERSPVPTSIVPVLGDSASVDDRCLCVTCSDEFVKGGPLAVLHGVGPVYFDPATKKRELLSDYSNEKTKKDICSAILIGMPRRFLQDTSNYASIHPGKVCNILMADGSVKKFRDLNGDQLLDPGFSHLPVELGSTEIFSAPLIDWADFIETESP